MKRTLRIFLIMIFFTIIVSMFQLVEANSIEKMSMDIYVDSNGDAHITEVWDCNTSVGTEVYHPYYNLGNSIIKDLTVSENGKEYTILPYWDREASIVSKAYKCGISPIVGGIEICWGMNSYGNHRYEVKYTITNFVSELTDSQMIYWSLIPHEFSTKISDAYIKIHTDFNIEDTIDVWGYGNYGGTAYVYDGYIEMQPPEDGLGENEYMTILVKFPKGTFNCENKLENNFKYYFKMAEKGAVKYEKNSIISFNIEVSKIIAYVIILLFILLIIILLLGIGNKMIHFDYGNLDKNNLKNVEYFRDIPCDGDIFRAYYVAYKYGLIKDKTDLLGAIILKWVKESLITIEQKQSGTVFKKENMIVVLNKINENNFINQREKELFKMLTTASIDGYLESKEFEIWCKKSYYKILSWFDRIIRVEEQKARENNLIEYTEDVALGVFKNKKYVVTPELLKQAEELAGLKRYLLDFSLIEDREFMEIELFEDYLIYAQMMGIAKKVAQQFEEIYPDIIKQSSYLHYNNIQFIYLCSTTGINIALTAKSTSIARNTVRNRITDIPTDAISRANDYSAGGGGFSSGGGGGGSFGGGGGGGGFR